jgi:hypothetical protein
MKDLVMLTPVGLAPQKDVIEEPTQNRSGINYFVKQQIGEVQGSFENDIRTSVCELTPLAKTAENTSRLCSGGTPGADVDCCVANHEQGLWTNPQLICCPKDRLRVWFRSERCSRSRHALEEVIKVFCFQDSFRTPLVAGCSNAERETGGKAL